MLKKRKLILGVAAIAFSGVLAILLLDLFVWLPDFSKLKESVEVPIRLANGDRFVRMTGPRTPGWVALSAMAEVLPRAVVASEDGTFYSHNGIDIFEMQEAFKKDLKEGRFARGASTITQQVLKNVYLTRYPKLWRKVKEIAWASRLEASLSKPQILAFYLNMAEWGPGLYGIGEASRHYFSVSPAALTPRQSAFLAMLLPSPRRYHAFFRKKQLTEWASKRVNRILDVMSRMNQLDPLAYETAMGEKLWGNSVVPDSTPGAPTDPGWGMSESPDEVFEAFSNKEEVPGAPPETASRVSRPSEAAPFVVAPDEPVPVQDTPAEEGVE